MQLCGIFVDAIHPGVGGTFACVCQRSFIKLMTWCSSWTSSVSPIPRLWRLAWKNRLCFNMKKFLVSYDGCYVVKKSGKNVGVVCSNGVSNNFIQCSQCMVWVHKKCSVSISNWLLTETISVPGVIVTLGPLIAEQKWMLMAPCLMWETHSAPVGTVSVPWLPHVWLWGKFRKHLAVLTTRHLSSRIRDKAYKACVWLDVIHGRDTWGPNNPELQRLRPNDRAIIHLICFIKDRDEQSSASLLWKLGNEGITSALHCRWLRWYGHVQLVMSCIKSITNSPIPDTRIKRMPRKTGENVWKLMSISVA